eukprot:Hpha_TRINITY_DN15335_c1_g6::TRINITY_DN15335_c1_g6_i3::g.92018::m.92018
MWWAPRSARRWTRRRSSTTRCARSDVAAKAAAVGEGGEVSPTGQLLNKASCVSLPPTPPVFPTDLLSKASGVGLPPTPPVFPTDLLSKASGVGLPPTPPVPPAPDPAPPPIPATHHRASTVGLPPSPECGPVRSQQ